MSADELTRVEVRIVGTAPLLMHNGRLSNPLDPAAKRMKEITAKKKKTDEDHLALARAEWDGSLYLDDEGRPCIPGEMLDAMMAEGAKKTKLGKLFKSAVFTDAGSYPLVYDGPKDIEKLYADGKFIDSRGVRNQMNRVQRTRPRFNKWSLEFAVTIIPGAGVNPKDVCGALETAGLLVGIGDFRPRFGRFTVEKFD